MCEEVPHPVELGDMGGGDEVRIHHRLELHLDADFRVAHHQLGLRVLRLQRQQRRQAGRPANAVC